MPVSYICTGVVAEKEYNMNEKTQNIWEKYGFGILIAITALVFFLFNLLTPHVVDDYTYMDGQSLLDIVQKEYRQYMTMNGRSIAHFLARIFLTRNKLLFDTVNTVVFLWLTLCIYCHANGTHRKQDSAIRGSLCYLFIPCALWLFIDVVGQTCLWLTGSCNYLWGATWIMSALLPYSLYFLHDQPVCRHLYQRIGLFLLAFVAGWSSENTSGALILIILCWLAYGKITKTGLRSWMVYGLIGSLGGFSMLLFSPGHSARLADLEADERNILIILAERFKNATEFLFTSQLLLLLLLAFFIVLHIHQKRPFSVIFSEGLFGFAALACEYALIFSPGRQTDRTTLGVTILLVIACSIGLRHTDYSLPSLHFLRSLMITVLVIFTLEQSVLGAYDAAICGMQARQRDAYTKSMLDKGVRHLQLPMITPVPNTKYAAQYGLTDFAEDETYWCNRVYCGHWNNVYNSHTPETIQGIDYDRWNMVCRHAEARLLKCTDPTDYLRQLKKKGYVAFLTVQDDASNSLNAKDKRILKKLGVKKIPKFRESFFAVINDGKCVKQGLGAQKLGYQYKIQYRTFALTSQGNLNGSAPSASISMDGTELTTLRGGLNIVVYSKEKDAIVDSVTFKLWADRSCTR